MRFSTWTRPVANTRGHKWRMLPSDFPPWKTVYDHYSDWNRRKFWEKVLDGLTGLHRKKNGRPATPSYGIVDSQSVKTIAASEQRGFDGGKKTKGRKRHIVVDTLGNLIQVLVHAANIHDTKAGKDVLKAAAEKYPSIGLFQAMRVIAAPPWTLWSPSSG